MGGGGGWHWDPPVGPKDILINALFPNKKMIFILKVGSKICKIELGFESLVSPILTERVKDQCCFRYDFL